MTRAKLWRWSVMLTLGGWLLQTATSCTEVGSQVATEASVAVLNQYIRTLMSSWLGISTGISF